MFREFELHSTSLNVVCGAASLKLVLGRKPPRALLVSFLKDLCRTMPRFLELELEEQLRSLSSCR
jgi:hypothetical protein